MSSNPVGTPLNADRIKQLLSETRTRGDYDIVLQKFYESGEAGIEVDFTGNLAAKDATNVYTGLNLAKKRQDKDGNLVHPWGPTIKVIKKNFGGNGKEGNPEPDEHVFLINTSLVEGVNPESESDDEEAPVEAEATA